MDDVSPPDDVSNNLNNINELGFYHEIRGNLTLPTPHGPQRGRPQHGGGAALTGAPKAARVVVGASAIDHILPFTGREIAVAKEGVQGLSPSLPCGARLT